MPAPLWFEHCGSGTVRGFVGRRLLARRSARIRAKLAETRHDVAELRRAAALAHANRRTRS